MSVYFGNSKIGGIQVTFKNNNDNLNLQSKTTTPTKSIQTITPDNNYDGLSKVTVNAIPNEYINTSDATATAGDMLEGKTAYVNGNKITGTIPTLSSINSEQGAEFGNIILVDKIPKPTNGFGDFHLSPKKDFVLKKDGDGAMFSLEIGTAQQQQVLTGVTFTSIYGSNLTGTLITQTYRTGSGAPSNDLGSDGDLYFDMG